MAMVFGRNAAASATSATKSLFQSIDDSSESDLDASEQCSRGASRRGRRVASDEIDGSRRERSRSRARSIAEKVASHLAQVSPRRPTRSLGGKGRNTLNESKDEGPAASPPSTVEDSCSIASESTLRDALSRSEENNSWRSRNHCSSSSITLSSDTGPVGQSDDHNELESDVPASPRRSRFWRPLSPFKEPSAAKLGRNHSGIDIGRPGLLSAPSLLDIDQLSKHSLLGAPIKPRTETLKPLTPRRKCRDALSNTGHNSLPAIAFELRDLTSMDGRESLEISKKSKHSKKGDKIDASSCSPKTEVQRKQKSSGKKSRDSAGLSDEIIELTSSRHKNDPSHGHTTPSIKEEAKSPSRETKAESGNALDKQPNVSSCMDDARQQREQRAGKPSSSDQTTMLSPKKSIRSSTSHSRSGARSPVRSKSTAVRSPKPRIEDRKDDIVVAKDLDDLNLPRSSTEPKKSPRKSRSQSSKQRRDRTLVSSSTSTRTNDAKHDAANPKTPVRHKTGARPGHSESLSACLEQDRPVRTPNSGRSVATEIVRSKDSASVNSEAKRRIRSRSVGRKTPRTPRSRQASRAVQASATPGRRNEEATTPHSIKRSSSRHEARARKPRDDGNNSLAQLLIPSLSEDKNPSEDVSVAFFKPNLVRPT